MMISAYLKLYSKHKFGVLFIDHMSSIWLPIFPMFCSLSFDLRIFTGQEDYASVRDTFLRSGDGFICVFSLTDMDSFNHISELHSQVYNLSLSFFLSFYLSLSLSVPLSLSLSLSLSLPSLYFSLPLFNYLIILFRFKYPVL